MARRLHPYLAAASVAFLITLPLGGAVASAQSVPMPVKVFPADAGDLWPDFVTWVDESDNPVKVVTPGHKVRAKFTIRNPQTYPLKVTGVDTQVIADQCQADVKRVTSKVNPNNLFPLYLLPDQRSGALYDEWFSLAATSRCSQVSLWWVANGIAEQTTTPFPTPTPTVTPVASPTDVEIPASEPTETPDPQPKRKSLVPLYVGGGVAILVIIAGSAMIARSRKK